MASQIKESAAHLLPAFGKSGIDALRDVANNTGGDWWSLLTLAMVATEQQPERWWSDWPVNLWAPVIVNPDLRSLARKHLLEYILGIESEELARQKVAPLIALQYGTPTLSRELMSALTLRTLALGPRTIQQYQALLDEKKDDEPALHEFLVHHPQMLDPQSLRVWSKPDLYGVQEPDFVVRRIDDTYLIVEIETPGKMLITRANQVSSHVTHAVKQVTDYRQFLVDRPNAATKMFPGFSDPECLVVIGNEGLLTQQQQNTLKQENSSRHKVRIVGFDWLSRRAEAVTRNVIERSLATTAERLV